MVAVVKRGLDQVNVISDDNNNNNNNNKRHNITSTIKSVFLPLLI